MDVHVRIAPNNLDENISVPARIVGAQVDSDTELSADSEQVNSDILDDLIFRD